MACMGDYLSGLWHVLAKPDWLANTGVPILATFIGLYVAYGFLKRQLASDERLRRGDQRREIAARLGRELVAVASEMNGWMWWDEIWQRACWPRYDALKALTKEARLLLPEEAIGDFRNILSSINYVFVRCANEGRARGADLNFHVLAVKRILVPYSNTLTWAGNDLIAWDGIRLLRPLLTTYCSRDWYSPENKQFFDKLSADYNSTVDDLQKEFSERGQDALIKPLGSSVGNAFGGVDSI